MNSSLLNFSHKVYYVFTGSPAKQTIRRVRVVRRDVASLLKKGQLNVTDAGEREQPAISLELIAEALDFKTH